MNQMHTKHEIYLRPARDEIAAVKGLQLMHQDLRLLRKPNGGLSSARNHGLDNIRGRFVVLLDTDDELIPYAGTHFDSFGCDVVRMRDLSAVPLSPGLDALVLSMTLSRRRASAG